MPRPVKRLLDARRVRRIRDGFSWIDRRFLRDGWIDKLERDEILLYFFLTAAADKDGLSYYSDPRVRGILGIAQQALEHARARLQDVELVAYEPPLYQVLALDVPPQRTGDLLSIKDVFRKVTERDRGQ